MDTTADDAVRKALFGRYADPDFTELELAALDWLDGFYQLEHLLAARDWAIQLAGKASFELKFAALTHDAERFFPGGPSGTPQGGFDNPDYLFAHSIRSADIVVTAYASIWSIKKVISLARGQ